MPIVAEIVKKTLIGQENGIVPAGTSPSDLDIFKTVIDETHLLRDAGVIEIVLEQTDRIRFKRLR